METKIFQNHWRLDLWINKIFNSTNFEDTESTNFFQRTLENEGVFEELKKMGVKEGDTVKVCELEFDYYD